MTYRRYAEVLAFHGRNQLDVKDCVLTATHYRTSLEDNGPISGQGHRFCAVKIRLIFILYPFVLLLRILL